jgi:hypothetical protein
MTTFAERRQEADEDDYVPKLEGPCPDCGRTSLVVTRHLEATMAGPAEWDYRCTSEDCEWET